MQRDKAKRLSIWGRSLKVLDAKTYRLLPRQLIIRALGPSLKTLA
jgi:hypothetical protein